MQQSGVHSQSSAATSHPLARARARWLILVGASLAAGVWLIWASPKAGFHWAEFLALFQQLDERWVAAAAGLALLSLPVRAARWQLLLKPLGRSGSFWGLLSATAIGYMAVVGFGRAGEVVRPYLIAQREGLTLSSQLGAWLAERICDVLAALLLFGLAVVELEQHRMVQGTIATFVRATGWVASIAGLAALATGIFLARYSELALQRLSEALEILPAGQRQRWQQRLASLLKGAGALGRGELLWGLALWTVAEWGTIVAAYRCTLESAPATAHLGWLESMVVAGLVTFGSAVQLPGLGGGVQVATIVVLTQLFDVTLEAATAVALLLWASTVLVTFPAGLAAALIEGLSWHRLREIEREGLL